VILQRFFETFCYENQEINMKKLTTHTIRKMKQKGEKITMLTAYDYPTAKIMDENNVDMILVGDSLGMVILGYEDTTKVTVDDIVHHTRAVTRAAKRAMVVADMPFLSYHLGVETSVKNAGRLMQEGNAGAIKLEGGSEVVDSVRAIVNAGIPVMGHLGLTPQSIKTMGGYFIQGKKVDEAERMLEEAKLLQEAGAFSLVLECVPSELAEYVSNNIDIPVIGIGSGNKCDGQVLVFHDFTGYNTGFIPKFVKKYGNVGEEIKKCVTGYIDEVKNGTFPSEEYSFFSEALTDLNKEYGE
jgi:3-methyl-2-oxobutanoate hydroxymethyltransferase